MGVGAHSECGLPRLLRPLPGVGTAHDGAHTSGSANARRQSRQRNELAIDLASGSDERDDKIKAMKAARCVAFKKGWGEGR